MTTRSRNILPIRSNIPIAMDTLSRCRMRGVKSEGMVLAATSADGKVELLDPPADSAPGDKVFFQGFEAGTYAAADGWMDGWIS